MWGHYLFMPLCLFPVAVCDGRGSRAASAARVKADNYPHYHCVFQLRFKSAGDDRAMIEAQKHPLKADYRARVFEVCSCQQRNT